MAYKALDISRYIINYSNQKNYGVSNLKLQKLLYFVQAEFLTYSENKVPCFDEEIEAWGFGPVVPHVYQAFKQYGSGNIPTITEYIEMTDTWQITKKTFDENVIKAKDRKKIAEIIEGLSDYSATALVNITHNQAPWINAYEKGMNNVITKRSIQEYFENDEN